MSTNDDRAADGGTRPSPFDVDTAYPILTTPVRSGSGCATDPCGDLGKRARDAISDVLGWKFRADDPTAFLAALTSSFTLTKVEGHTEARWRPQGFAVQADLGAVTGAQASLAARARSAVAEATVLLDALVPLRVDFDAEVAEGFRALVRHDLDALRQELDSPLIRLPRVDQLFRLLLFQREHRQADDSAAPVIDPGTVRGHLGMLRDSFGLSPGQVSSINDERVQTSFITIVDWVWSLYSSWSNQRALIDPFGLPPGQQGYFGPTMIAVSQVLAATVAQVEELCCALDSVLINAGEREVLRVPVPGQPNPRATMPLGRLLSWIHDFASFEGRTLVESAGKDGVDSAFYFVARQLLDTVARLPSRPDQQPRLPAGFFSRRVQVAIDALREDLWRVVALVEPVSNPDAGPDGPSGSAVPGGGPPPSVPPSGAGGAGAGRVTPPKSTPGPVATAAAARRRGGTRTTPAAGDTSPPQATSPQSTQPTSGA